MLTWRPGYYKKTARAEDLGCGSWARVYFFGLKFHSLGFKV